MIETKDEKISIVFTPISFNHGMAGSQRLKNLVKLLSKENIECKNLIISPIKKSTSKENKSNLIRPVFYNKNLFSIFLLPFKIFFSLKYFKVNGKNILYNYGYIQIQNLYIILIAKILGYKIVLDIVEDNRAILEYKNRWARFRIKSSLFFLKYLNFLVQGIIVINDHLYELLTKYYRSAILKIPISIDISEFADSDKQLNYNIFYGGSFGKKDGLSFLLSAFASISEKFPEAKLIITGNGSKRDLDVFNKDLIKIKNRNRILLKGYVTRSEYLNLLITSAVCCMTRIDSDFARAGFPFKLGEMLASGNPVICSRIGEIEKFLNHKSNALLVDPESESQIVDNIQFVFENRSISNIIGTKGKIVAFENFNLNQFKNQILNFFLSL